MSFFSDMRNLLLFLYDSESISDEEFMTLFEIYSSKNPDLETSRIVHTQSLIKTR